MGTPNPADTAAPNPNDAGVVKAKKIEDLYSHSGAHAAEAALRADYLATNSDTASQATLKAEMARLSQDSAATHLLPHLALDWASPLAKDDRLTSGRLQDYQNHTGSQSDAFDAQMAGIVQGQYHDLTSGWQGHLLPWEKGINSNDITKAENGYEADRQNNSLATMLQANNGDMFRKIAGVHSTIDSDTMQAALDYDKAQTTAGKPPLFTGDQRATAQYAVDHWDDSTTQKLMGSDASENYGISLDTLKKAYPNAGAADAASPPPAAPPDAAAAAAARPPAAPAAAGASAPPAKGTTTRGEGYWDVAAQELGLESTDATKSLLSRRHEMNAKLTGAQRTQIATLMKELESSGRGPAVGQSFNFTVTDGVPHYAAPADSAS